MAKKPEQTLTVIVDGEAISRQPRWLPNWVATLLGKWSNLRYYRIEDSGITFNFIVKKGIEIQVSYTR